MATSINGFVAGENDDTDWVKDIDALYKIIAEKKVCVMGRRTYDECMKFNAFPYKNALNIVMTHDKNLLNKSVPNSIFTNSNPTEVFQLLQSKGYEELLIIGGGHINSQFLAAGLIDDIIIDVHPIIIDNGVQLFEDIFPRVQLQLVETLTLNDGIVQNHYQVIK